MLLTHALALSANQFFMQERNPYEYAPSVIIELAKLILVGTRITYQATGDAGLYIRNACIYYTSTYSLCVPNRFTWYK